jgi:hypothetical protein
MHLLDILPKDRGIGAFLTCVPPIQLILGKDGLEIRVGHSGKRHELNRGPHEPGNGIETAEELGNIRL